MGFILKKQLLLKSLNNGEIFFYNMNLVQTLNIKIKLIFTFFYKKIS